MPSPFPGMNPYLEQNDVWDDFHERFLPLAADVLAAQVDPGYIVKLGEHLYIHELSGEARHFLGRTDVSVAPGASAPSGGGGTAVAAAPARVWLPAVDVERLSNVEIRDRRSRQLITVLELLSPSNKRTGADRDQYLGKRGELLASGVHFVEIDLLRGGPRMPMNELPECDYCVLVSRYEERPAAAVWPVRLRDRLPVVPVPLREPGEEARLDLQELLHRVYDAARYGTYVYDGEPQPRLSPDDAAWAEALVPRRAG
jgi:hypothetical protein